VQMRELVFVGEFRAATLCVGCFLK
jgi:hypothetical protein